jgi:large subunit ribosomal protein LP0
MTDVVEDGVAEVPEIPLKPKMAKKQKYFASLHSALDEFDQAFIVNADNVGSKQIQQIRAVTRKESLIVFGKNTQMKKAIRQKVGENPDLERLLPHLVGNVGLVFTKGDLGEIRKLISLNKVPAPARTGAVAQCAVTIPAGLTGMEPTQTQFFQALNIPTKINKGQIEIISDVQLFKAGDKVSSSEVALLAKMNMKPFTYGLKFIQVYDKGSVYTPDVLDVTDEQLLSSLKTGIARVAAASLAVGHPTQASVPHSMMNGLKNLVAVSLVSDYVIGPAEKIKAILDDPEALAAMAAAASAAPSSGGGADKAPAEAPAAAEEEEEEEEDVDFDLFD